MAVSAQRLTALLVAAVLTLTACSGLPAREDGDDDDSPLIALQLSGPAARYLAVAEPANATLDTAFDGLEDADSDLAAEQADFRLAAATERSFDRGLKAIEFAAPIKATARAMININESRAALTDQAAGSTTQDQVEAYENDIDLLNFAVEQQVDLIRTQLGLPPPDTS
jgi:hypothetical protein